MQPRIWYATAGEGVIIAERAGDRPVPWWSFTKTAIAAAALTLVRDGALQLDSLVPGRPYTLRHLLQNRAGLGDYGDLPAYREAVARGAEPWPVAELLRRARADRLRYEPGRGWRYSNLGYLVVRQLVEHATGEPLGAVLRRRVLEPLDIARAALACDRADLTGVEMGDAGEYDPRWVYHGLLVGPLGEAALLLERLLAGALLPEALLRAMLASHPVGPPPPGRPWRAPGYGLGLMLDAPDGTLATAGHTGGGPGSVIAVYRSNGPDGCRTTAAFAPGGDTGAIERVAFTHRAP